MSLTQALNTSTSGLRTVQAGLSLIASNVANAETPGYVRKTLVQTTTSAGGAGVSVRIAAVNRELDIYLQRQLRTEAAGGSYANLRAEFYSRLQSIYGQPGADATLEVAFNDFASAVQTLGTSPESPAARAAVISAAQVLTQQLNGMTNDIQALRSDAELGLNDAVSRANNAMERIAAINRQLALNTTPDAAAATLLDQRDMYIDELSQLMDIRVISTDNNQVTVFTNSGIQLVSTEASRLDFDAKGTIMPTSQWTADPATRSVGTISLVTPTGNRVDLLASNAIRSGEIAAFVEMRDHILPEAQAQLDAIAAAMASSLSDATVAGNAVTTGAYEGFDVDTAALLPGNKINLTWTDTTTGQQHRVTIVRVDDPAALPLSNDFTADAGDTVIGVDFSGGLSSVVAQLNNALNGRVNFSNPSGTTLRILDDGAANNSTVDAVTSTVTRTGFGGGDAYLPFFTDAGTPYTGAVTANGSQTVGLAGRLVVNGQLIADPAKLVVFQAGGAAGDSTRPNFILSRLMDTPVTFSSKTGIGSAATPYTGSLSSFLRQVIGAQGEAAENAANLASGQEVVVNALKSRVSEASTVNIDIEMANLLTLQSAYGANARVLSVVKEMMERLLSI
ncbi:flagellar hook-associated protein FlgK [Pseudorhodoplanes sp.]|uniref:flagellar hook-associated protein FlgK n=1 Tax=Pseudorhodoplanes sp. TaxID=1934341 RepID=UPI002CBF5621|nr:flagellar hook-associated protein FlgK [Pseudorhodoplanes sp.]HWV54347.1 flagellar hook-associated protein FlgK [Pseudorhodoplanes sp.]